MSEAVQPNTVINKNQRESVGRAAFRCGALLWTAKAPTMKVSIQQCEKLQTVQQDKQRLAQLYSDLYDRYRSELVHYLQGQWRKAPEDAADIAQQAFERFMNVAEPEGIEQPRAYLFQLVRNLVVDGLRRDKVRSEHAQREGQEEEVASGDCPLGAALGGEQLQVLQQVIEKLPAKRRRAFVLNRVYQMSYREIAEEMAISPDSVKKHVMRALETCQKHLQNRFEE